MRHSSGGNRRDGSTSRDRSRAHAAFSRTRDSSSSTASRSAATASRSAATNGQTDWEVCRRLRKAAKFDLGRVYELLETGKPSVAFPRLVVPARSPITIALRVVLPDNIEGDATFDVIQRARHGRIAGGSTYVLRAPSRERPTT